MIPNALPTLASWLRIADLSHHFTARVENLGRGNRQGGKSLAEMGFYRGGVGSDPNLSVFSSYLPTITTEKDSAGIHHRVCS